MRSVLGLKKNCRNAAALETTGKSQLSFFFLPSFLVLYVALSVKIVTMAFCRHLVIKKRFVQRQQQTGNKRFRLNLRNVLSVFKLSCAEVRLHCVRLSVHDCVDLCLADLAAQWRTKKPDKRHQWKRLLSVVFASAIAPLYLEGTNPCYHGQKTETICFFAQNTDAL
jgi:hypothetical protein